MEVVATFCGCKLNLLLVGYNVKLIVEKSESNWQFNGLKYGSVPSPVWLTLNCIMDQNGTEQQTSD